MEESKIVENFTILLYSRTYETLYLQIFHSENKNLLSKHVIKTSDHVTIDLGMPLNQVQMMVKKSQESMQILNEFKFRFEDFSTNSTVEQMDHYIKLKKRFQQYSLLFQIFYRLKSPINSANDIDKQEEKEAMRISQIEKKKQHLNELKNIAKSNLVLLEFKVMNTLFRKKARTKTTFPSDESLGKKPIRKNKKNKTTFVEDKSKQKMKKPKVARSNIGKFSQINTSKDFSKQLSIQDEFQRFKDSKDDIYEKDFPKKHFVMRNNKKHLTIEGQKSEFVKKRSSKKKITFNEDAMSIKNRCQEPNDDFTKVKSLTFRSHKLSSSSKKQTNICKEIESKYQKNQDNTIENSRMIEFQQDHEDKNENNLIPSPIKPKSNNEMIIRKLKKLCQQKSGQKIFIKRKYSSKVKFTESTFMKSFDQKSENMSELNETFMSPSKTMKSRFLLTNKTNKSYQCFYQNLYEKTRKSIDRQNEIINFVKNSFTITEPLQAYQIMSQSKSQQKVQDLRIINTSTILNQKTQIRKRNILTKVKSQESFAKKYKSYLNNKKVLRS